ncbi:DUF1273 domain-containing protein [Cohnella xylanilytica]|uniref:DUF1273 domain-containing protein n=1 Tax=Cohnella xylanilytica TaxID=557555 RepID=A0A841UA58_9BACL|nr:DUF1273 domain-containing protein [Cohnella xylanilytica]MBB6695123.1 DUF1273 domain-containing protein [Cohnella xylanilytica]
MKTLLVTGYRAHELGIFDRKHKGIEYIKRAIAAKLVPLIEEGLEWVITPGQFGVDLWACETAIELKTTYPHLKLSILTAYSNPEEKWKDDRKEYYHDLLKKVDYYGAVSKQPYSGPWQFKARDELLFRKTDGILLVYDEDSGEGSPKFFKETALRKNASEGYRYISIGQDDIQSIAEESSYRYE